MSPRCIVHLRTVCVSTKLVAPVSLTPLLETRLPRYSSLKWTHIGTVHCFCHQRWRVSVQRHTTQNVRHTSHMMDTLQAHVLAVAHNLATQAQTSKTLKLICHICRSNRTTASRTNWRTNQRSHFQPALHRRNAALQTLHRRHRQASHPRTKWQPIHHYRLPQTLQCYPMCTFCQQI